MTTSGGSSGGSSSKDSSGSSNDSLYEKRKDTAGTGRVKDLTGSTTASLSETSGGDKNTIAAVSKGASSVYESGGGSNRSLSPTTGGGGGGGGAPQTGGPNPGVVTPGTTEGVENTSITATPRSDFSVVLAGQVGKRPDRSPARSNNFISLVGGAGGLGRRSAEAKRSLIGGA